MHEKLRGRRGVLALSLVAAMVLSACGGGGGGGETAPPPPTAVPESLAITAPGTAEVASATQFGNSAAALVGLKYSWNFGDGSSSTEASPSHSYTKGGDYEVVLKVSNEAGASRETRVKLTVNNLAQARGLVCSGANDGGWCWQQPLPTGSERRDVFFLDAQTGWMVGGNGEIFKTVDAGASWQRQASGVDVNLNMVHFADANRGWILGEHGALLRTTDGGAQWQLSKTAEVNQSGALVLADGQVLILRDGPSTLRVSEDGGVSWRALSAQLIEASKNKVIWSIKDGHVHKSTDLGFTSHAILDVRSSYSSNYELRSVGEQGLLVKRWSQTWETGTAATLIDFWFSRDGGVTWDRPALQGLPKDQFGYWSRLVYVAPSGTVLMKLVSGTLYRSENAGESWTELTLHPEVRFLDANGFFVLDEQTLIYSYGQLFFLSQDGGANWKPMSKPNGDSVYGAVSVRRALSPKPGVILLLLGDGSSYLTSDLGASWRLVGGQSQAQRAEAIKTFAAVDAKRILAINGKHELLESKDGGRNWQLKRSGLYQYGAPLLSFASSTAGWMTLGDGRLYRTVDGGETWTSGLQSSFGQSMFFHFIDEKQGWTSSNGRLWHSQDGGESWSEVGYLPDGAGRVRFFSVSHGFAFGYLGLHETRDGGKTWSSRFTGAVNHFVDLAYADAKNVWALSYSGEVLQSHDGGETWKRANLFANGSSWNAIRFLDGNHGWVTQSDGQVLATTNGGKTWQRQNSGTNQSLRQIQFVDAKTGWLLGEGGALLTTGTGGF